MSWRLFGSSVFNLFGFFGPSPTPYFFTFSSIVILRSLLLRLAQHLDPRKPYKVQVVLKRVADALKERLGRILLNSYFVIPLKKVSVYRTWTRSKCRLASLQQLLKCFIRTQAQELFQNVRKGFLYNLQHEVTWMDDVTKAKARAKAEAIRGFFGYNAQLYDNATLLDQEMKQVRGSFSHRFVPPQRSQQQEPSNF